MIIEITKQIKMVKWIRGKEYPVVIDILDDGKMRLNLSKHPGSREQLEGILTSIADKFGATLEVENHIPHEHIHDNDLEKETVSLGGKS